MSSEKQNVTKTPHFLLIFFEVTVPTVILYQGVGPAKVTQGNTQSYFSEVIYL